MQTSKEKRKKGAWKGQAHGGKHQDGNRQQLLIAFHGVPLAVCNAGFACCCGWSGGWQAPSGQSHSASLSSLSLHSPNCRCGWKMQHSAAERNGMPMHHLCEIKCGIGGSHAHGKAHSLFDFFLFINSLSTTSSAHCTPCTGPSTLYVRCCHAPTSTLRQRYDWSAAAATAQRRDMHLPRSAIMTHLALFLLLGHQAQHQVLCKLWAAAAAWVQSAVLRMPQGAGLQGLQVWTATALACNRACGCRLLLLLLLLLLPPRRR